MPDYFAQVHGVLPSGRSWSTGRHITSNQTEAELLTTWQNAWTSAWNLATTGLSTVFPAGLSITQFTVATLNGSMRELTKSAADVDLVGTATGDSLPSNSSVVIDWRSNSVQRTGRGRQALPPVAEDMSTLDMLTTTAKNNIKAAMTTVRTAVNADGSTFFVFPTTETKNGTPPFTKTVLTSVSVRDKVGSQRRRYKKEPVSYT